MSLQHPVEEKQTRQLLENVQIQNRQNQIQPQIYHEPQQNKQPEIQGQQGKRKRLRRRQVQQLQANQFLKQPVVKINNLNKNLKRAYQKGFFDDTKFDFIRSLRKIRRHPEQDSVSSHYRSDDQSFDINDVLPKRGFQKKRAIGQNGDILSSSNSEEPKEKKVSSKPKKPRKPREPKPPGQPRQTRQPKQAKIKKQGNEEKQLKKQVKNQDKTAEQQKKGLQKRTGVQIKVTKAPNQQTTKSQKKQNQQDSKDESQSQFKSSSGEMSEQEKIEMKIRESQVMQPEIKQKNKETEMKKLSMKQISNNNENPDKLKITVQQTQKIMNLPPKPETINLNPQLPAPLVANKLLPPNIPARKSEEPPKIDLKQLLPQDSKNYTSDNSSSSDSSSSSSSSSDSRSSSSDEQGGKKKQKEKKKKHRKESSSSDQSLKHKKKKKKKARKNKHKVSENPSESLITKLIKDDNLRKMLVKQKQKEVQLKLKQIQDKQKKQDKLKNQVKNTEGKGKQQEKKDQLQKANNHQQPQVQNEKQIEKIEKQTEVQKLNKIQEQKADMPKIKQVVPQLPKQKQKKQKPVEHKSQQKSQPMNEQKQKKSIIARLKDNAKPESILNHKVQPKLSLAKNTQIIFKQDLSHSKNEEKNTKKQGKPNLKNLSLTLSEFPIPKSTHQVQKLQRQTKQSNNHLKKQGGQNLSPKQQALGQKKSKKIKNLTMQNKVVVLQLMVGTGQQHSQAKDKSSIGAQKLIEKEKDIKQQKIHREQRTEEKRMKHRQVIKYEQSDQSSDSSSAKYYNTKKKYRQVPQKVMRYRKVVVERSESQDSQSSDQYVKRRIVRRVKRGAYQSSQSSSEEARDYRVFQRRKNQKAIVRQRK